MRRDTMPSESPVMNFEEEKAKLLEEKAALAQKGPKQKLTAKDDTASNSLIELTTLMLYG